jgi:hypothetical protein
MTMEGIPPNLLNQRIHWSEASRQKKAWATKVKVAAMLAMPRRGDVPVAQPTDRHRVTITFYYCGTAKDHEGAVASAKPLIDILQTVQRVKAGRQMVEVPGLGLIYQDDLEHIGKPEINQVRVATRAEQRTVIRIEKQGEGDEGMDERAV